MIILALVLVAGSGRHMLIQGENNANLENHGVAFAD